MMKLDCESGNGNMPTENTAKIRYSNGYATIGYIYANSRIVDDAGNLVGYNINGKTMPKAYGKSYYLSLWYHYFKKNEQMIKAALKFDEYYDLREEGAYNSPAQAYRILKNYGINGLYSNSKEYIEWYKENIKYNEPKFDELKEKAKMFIDIEDDIEFREKTIEAGDKTLYQMALLLRKRKKGQITNDLYKVSMDRIRENLK